MMPLLQNLIQINIGLFSTSQHQQKSSKITELISRFFWQFPQTLLGWFIAHIAILLGYKTEVHHLFGITLIKIDKHFGGFALGNYIFGDRSIYPSPSNELFAHEYGHYLQSRTAGPLYLFKYGLPSIISAYKNNYFEHAEYWTEIDANLRSKYFFQIITKSNKQESYQY